MYLIISQPDKGYCEMKITAENVFSEIQRQIRKIEKYGYQYSQQLRKEYGITGPQIGVLRMLPPDSAMSISELSKKMGLHITTVQDITKRLLRKKLVKLKKSVKDKRVVEVSVTAKGKKIMREAPFGRMNRFSRNLSRLSDEEAQQIYNTVVRIVELYGASDVEM